VGSALAAKLRGEDAVAVAYFGDGGSSKADFHEGLNFAAVHCLPVILFCENNGIAISVPFEKQSAVASVAERAQAYGVPGVSVDGADPLAVYEATRQAAERARAGGGPTLIEARVTRIGQHTSQVGDLRAPDELGAARGNDPLPRFAAYLEGCGLLTPDQAAALAARAEAEVADAERYAADAPTLPPEAAFASVYASA
jgi:2-oxoisovalerate dehydrogenase E1 component alpha subunit